MAAVALRTSGSPIGSVGKATSHDSAHELRQFGGHPTLRSVLIIETRKSIKMDSRRGIAHVPERAGSLGKTRRVHRNSISRISRRHLSAHIRAKVQKSSTESAVVGALMDVNAYGKP